MIALIQRVNWVKLSIDNKLFSESNGGLLLLLGIEKKDDLQAGQKLLNKVLSYRVFPDDEGRMNLSLTDIGGDLMLVSQFTLAAETEKGLRPGFSSAMPPDEAESLYDQLLQWVRTIHSKVESGQFGANMQIALENDGPVTFILRS
ncbi:MAG: D-aminoacyl-tRNA deacylase [Gammaproteobacteria bacterium]